ncbi:MAG: DivIVA domain-containing protein [Firmicutes bacterium]|nr:DivIVA domain-containing protein [Bacillota bacterium]
MLTPLEIHKKEFRRAFRGYSEEEVDTFLDRVVQDYERLYRENQELQERLQKTEGSIAQYRELEEVIKNTLVMAQKNAQELEANAAREAELIVREARTQAESILREARDRAERLLQEAEERAKTTVRAAEERAGELTAAAEARVEAILEEYRHLEAQARVFRARFESFLEAQLKLLREGGPWGVPEAEGAPPRAEQAGEGAGPTPDAGGGPAP